MTKALKQVFAFAFLASMSIFAQKPSKPCGPSCNKPNYAIDCCKNDSAKRSVLEQYREDLASGDAVIAVSDEEIAAKLDQQDEIETDITRRLKCKKNKCFCRLTVKECLKTRNLINCCNAVIGGNLRVNGTLNGVSSGNFVRSLENSLLNIRGIEVPTATGFINVQGLGIVPGSIVPDVSTILPAGTTSGEFSLPVNFIDPATGITPFASKPVLFLSTTGPVGFSFSGVTVAVFFLESITDISASGAIFHYKFFVEETPVAITLGDLLAAAGANGVSLNIIVQAPAI